MASLSHDDIVLEIPEGWTDATVVTLIGPIPAPTTPMSPRAPRTEAPSIVVKSVTKDDGGSDVAKFVALQDELLAAGLANLNVVDRQVLEANDTTMTVREFRFGPPEDLLRQVLIYIPRNDGLVVVCATAADDLHFKDIRRAATDVATSICRG